MEIELTSWKKCNIVGEKCFARYKHLSKNLEVKTKSKYLHSNMLRVRVYGLYLIRGGNRSNREKTLHKLHKCILQFYEAAFFKCLNRQVEYII